ncbi:MAG: hypothetical protein OEY52_13200 [Gammaproteobacteria bacterium]|nr:hypothetical protein [Gammaproteobacteria bacterium]
MNKSPSYPLFIVLLLASLFLSACGGGSSSSGNTPVETGDPGPGDPDPGDPGPSDPPSAKWQLPVGNYISAKMPMHLVYPRPDTETGDFARHKYAHPNMVYEIPVGVQGGAWPFKYELLQSPAGAKIGEVYGSTNYGSITWMAPDTGTYTFEVKITDQELKSVTATWEVTVDAAQFVFIQDGYIGTKTGTIDQPLEDIEDWYKGDRADTTFHNKIIVFREGSYSLIGGVATNGNVRLDTVSKTRSFISYPGEKPVIDCSKAKILTDSKSHDLFVAGIRWENGRQDVNNAHFFWAIGDVSRSTWWRNHFHNLGPGLVGNDNTLPVFVSNTSVLKHNILYKENAHTQINNFGFNGGYFEAYVSNHVLIEQNIASNSAVAYGFFAKGTRAYVSIRANTAINNVKGTQIAVGNNTESGDVPHDHEICWNNIKAPDENVLLISSGDNYAGQTFNSHIYRNTIIGDTAWVRFPGKENFKVDGNVVITKDMNAASSRWNTSIMDSDIVTNLTTDGSEDYVDVEGKLKGTFRDQYIGTHGHEIAF